MTRSGLSNRVIKFRAWDGEGMKPTFDLSQNPKYWWEQNKDYPLMQFTGLHDKNGVEIWEGDILRRHFEIGNTIYDPVTLGAVDYEITESGCFVGVVHYRPSEGFVLGKVRKYNDENELVEKKSAVKIYSKYAEVIGNIYEHPHLLEGS